MYEIFNLAGQLIDTVDLATARFKYGSVQYGWRVAGSMCEPK